MNKQDPPGTVPTIDGITSGASPETTTLGPSGEPHEKADAGSISVASKTRKTRKRTKSLVALLAVLVVAATAFAAYALFAGLIREKALIRQAEPHYEAARLAVATASSSIEGARHDDSDKIGAILESDTEAIRDALSALRTGRREIAAARVSIGRLNDSPPRKDYLDSLTSLSEAVDRLEGSVAQLSIAKELLSKASDAADMEQQPAADLGDAISAANSNKYAPMRPKAQAAFSGYAKVVALSRAVHRLDESGGLDKWAANIERRRKLAKILIGMAEGALSGDADRWNNATGLANRLQRQISGPDESNMDTTFYVHRKRASQLNASAAAARRKADELRAKALKAWRYDE